MRKLLWFVAMAGCGRVGFDDVAELYMAAAPTPGFTGGTDISLVLNGLDVALRYVVVIDRP